MLHSTPTPLSAVRRLPILVLLALVGCTPTSQGSSGSPAGAPTATRQQPSVVMNDANQFMPADLTVARGGTVVWTNTGQMVHSVTDDPSKAINKTDAVLPSGAQPWDSGLINAGQTFSHTFDVPGQYAYFCIPHETLGMVGRITVSS
jgi:plastocyanin